MKIVVTGATGTIGTAICHSLRNDGHELISIGRTESEISDKHVAIDLENVNAEQLKSSTFDEVSGVVICAGTDSRLSSRDFDPDVFRRVLEVNCTSQLYLLSLLLAKTTSTDFRVFAVSSDTLSGSDKESLVYSTSKAALEEGVRMFAVEEQGRVTGVSARLGFIGRAMRVIAEKGVVEQRGDPDEEMLSMWTTRVSGFFSTEDRVVLQGSYEVWQ